MSSYIANLHIPESAWEPSSDPDDGRLLCTVNLLGTLHHLEAIPVKQNDAQLADHEQAGATPIAEDVLSDYYVAFGADSPFSTVQIDGRDYCLFLSPFCT